MKTKLLLRRDKKKHDCDQKQTFMIKTEKDVNREKNEKAE